MNSLAIAILRRRPFSRSHWSLLLILVAAWDILLIAQSCKTGMYYLELTVATITVCLALWSNHVAVAPVLSKSGWGLVVGRALYDLLALSILLVLTGLPFAVIVPHYDCLTERHKAAEVLLMASDLRLEIEARATAQGKLDGAGVGLSVLPKGRVKGGLVTRDGIVVVASDDPVIVFFLTPTFHAGKLEWACLGYPEKIAPRLCHAKPGV